MRISVTMIMACAVLAVTPLTAAAAESGKPLFVTATYRGYQPDAQAVTYRPDLVPAGARATVLSWPSPGRTTVVFNVSGLVPGREYGAHVHSRPCGRTGNDAGPHYQHIVDPVQPSVDPRYANPANEIWLDLTADRWGNGLAVARVNWQFTDRRAGSVVLHETHTNTHPGHAGTAGARLACVRVPF